MINYSSCFWSHYANYLGTSFFIWPIISLPPAPGDIQIGMMDKKGQLEVEVIRARGLVQKPGSKNLPGEKILLEMEELDMNTHTQRTHIHTYNVHTHTHKRYTYTHSHFKTHTHTHTCIPTKDTHTHIHTSKHTLTSHTHTHTDCSLSGH